MYTVYVLCCIVDGLCLLLQFELLSIASFLQLLFIGLKLDNITGWTWAVSAVHTNYTEKTQ